MLRDLARRPVVEDRAIRDEQLWGAWAAGNEPVAVSHAGVRVSRESAIQLSAVWAAVSLISESIASMPLDAFFLQRGTRRPFRPKPLWIDRPNRDQERHQWVQQQLLALLLDGNAYVYTPRARSGEVLEVWNVAPWKVNPRRENRRIVYDVTDTGVVGSVTLTSDEMFHIPAMSWPGDIKGISPIQAAMRLLGAGLGAQEFAERYYGQGMMPAGVVEYPGELQPEQARDLKQDFARMNSGLAKAHLPAVLTGGAKWNATSISPEQAQFLETRSFTVSEIARFFRVPPHMIGDVEKQTSWGTGVEQQGLQFVTYTLMPWLERLEQAYTSRLFPPEASAAFAKFNINGLLRADIKTRHEVYAIKRNWGLASADEVRALEDEPPLPDGLGEEYLVPMNMRPADQPFAQQDTAAAPPSAGTAE